jgi:hypothetical protein
MNSYADIEHVPAERRVASATKVESSRSCFKELEAQGCGDPGVDMTHFRSCLNDSFSGLSDSCQSMMNRLYGK